MNKDFWAGYITASLVSFVSILFMGVMAHCSTIEDIIRTEALKQGLDPAIAISIAKIESSLNPNAIGPKKEVGLFQILPKYSPVNTTLLLNPKINARIGVMKLLEAQKRCALQDNLTWTICFNNGWRKPKYPELHPYYKRFINVWIKQ